MIAVQSGVPPAILPTAMAITIFSQSFGGAIFLSFCETILTNSLTSLIPKYSPRTSPETVIDAGASAFRSHVRSEDLFGVLMAYAKSIDRIFYLTMAASLTAFFAAWGMGWTDIRKGKKAAKPDVEKAKESKPAEEPSLPTA
jgi:hypothetical protein